MLTTKSFFDLSQFPHASLFDNNKPAWEALNHLKTYMDAHNYPVLDSDLLPNGIPLPESIICHKDHYFSTTGHTIEYGDTSKGKLRVTKNNEELVGASVIMAGAILIGGKIDIGKGAFIEGGALIKSPAIFKSVLPRLLKLNVTCCFAACLTGEALFILMDESRSLIFFIISDGDSVVSAGMPLGESDSSAAIILAWTAVS